MTLAEYLVAKHIGRFDFARQAGISPAWVTVLCDGGGWPSRAMAEKIRKATDGAVTPDDFLSATPEPACADPTPQETVGAV